MITILKARTYPLAALFLLLLAIAPAGCKKQDGAQSNGGGAVSKEEEYTRLMNSGKNYLSQGEGQKALDLFLQASKLAPSEHDAKLNLANAYLLLNQPEKAIEHCRAVMPTEPNSPAANFLLGSALLRLNQSEEALKALQIAKDVDPSIPAASFQLGMAHFQMKHWEEAVAEFQDTIALEENHPAAHYNLSQSLQRLGQANEAATEMEAHQKIVAARKGPPPTPATFEKSKYTEARVPFKLEQPAKEGIAVQFSDATAKAFSGTANLWRAPFAFIDINHDGSNDLFVMEGEKGFRLLRNEKGIFQAQDETIPTTAGNRYHKVLVGDLQNDRYEDIIVLGEKGSHLFKLATNGLISDLSSQSRLQSLGATDGALVDLDFTGSLDLVALTAANPAVVLYRQTGKLLFTNFTARSGIPADLTNARALVIEDANQDELMDAVVAREGAAPALLAKIRAGTLQSTNSPAPWPAGTMLALGDLNNDLKVDLVLLEPRGRGLKVALTGTESFVEVVSANENISQIILHDYDNDGWLDIWLFGKSIQAWRNTGLSGFIERTAELGLNKLKLPPVVSAQFADSDQDGDSDLVIATSEGLRLFTNEGGNANAQLKMRLVGNRSNSSGLGVKVEVASGGLRLTRTVSSLPIEIGVGKHQKLESMTVHWFDLAVPSVDVEVNSKLALVMPELILQTGSCPYVYVWDGAGYRFITDILGAAPLGLPVAKGKLIEADPDELVWIGNDRTMQPKDGAYIVQITEELREALYLDEAKLVVVDHPPGTEIQATDKLVPGKPFPPTDLILLHQPKPLKHGETLTGNDVTDLLREVDLKRVGPDQLREPQMRGMAYPHGVILDFGPLDATKPFALVMNGWLRFGGGMANIAASLDPDIPFPFPTFEVEAAGEWKKLEVQPAAPAGKTKTIVIELAGKLPTGAWRLRIQQGFEIYWDRIALMELADMSLARRTELTAASANLHWRGFSDMQDLPADSPSSPDYNKVNPSPKWTLTPSGWCTRYGPVDELISARDSGLAIINGGDELTLKFDAKSLPEKPTGYIRDFFLFTVGWDKDSDFHVVTGTKILPLPWEGMDDQLIGQQPRPSFPSDTLHQKYNTRWVGPFTLQERKSN